jgi:hypothetical protein
MNKLSKLTVITLLTAVSSFSFLQPIETQAALTAPTSYDYRYHYSSSAGYFVYGTFSTPWVNVPLYSRTADGVYYNYSTTFEPVSGLIIDQTFNRSNTSWNDMGGGYRATDTKIGSDNSVGSVLNKIYFEFDNQTNKDYSLFYDYSSTPADRPFRIEYNSNRYSNYIVPLRLSLIESIFIPSYTNVKLFFSTSSDTMYFDAWYLKDLGVSASFNNGYNAGELDGYNDGYLDGLQNNPNILLNGFEKLVGMIVNFTLMIFTLEVFDISLLSILAILVSIMSVVWILKAVRG